ncbi:MAG: hypothetical protein K1X83_14615 [Oligoflexia bacterium]|nr:hypothetical protein [Oligoflexia bacterium]
MPDPDKSDRTPESPDSNDRKQEETIEELMRCLDVPPHPEQQAGLARLFMEAFERQELAATVLSRRRPLFRAIVEAALTSGKIDDVIAAGSDGHPILTTAVEEYIATEKGAPFAGCSDDPERETTADESAAHNRFDSIVRSCLVEYVSLEPEARVAKFGPPLPPEYQIDESKILQLLQTGEIAVSDAIEALTNREVFKGLVLRRFE